MARIVDDLLAVQHRDSTSRMYLSIWRQFNKFIITLDIKPPTWEGRAILFLAFLVERGMQSATVRSYLSAIKSTLLKINYEWNQNTALLGALIRACKLKNDRVKTRLPIHCRLLELILFEVQRRFSLSSQHYLELLYKSLYILSYYGLMRVGEVTKSTHTIKAANVHIAKNKDKVLLILYSSKTHDEGSRPQKIKITSNTQEGSGCYAKRNFCPFRILRHFLKVRGPFADDKEPLFVFRDKSPVLAEHAQSLLRKLLKDDLGLEAHLYDMHSLRISRSSDLIKYGYSVEEVKWMGQWKSNAVFKYIRSWYMHEPEWECRKK